MNNEIENQTSEFAREIWKKSKRFCKDENCDAPQYIEVNEVFEIIHKYIENLQKKAELGEHYKYLYSEIKKQKDDVVEYIKYQLSNLDFYKEQDMKAKMLGIMILVMLEDKRMLGEKDDSTNI